MHLRNFRFDNDKAVR